MMEVDFFTHNLSVGGAQWMIVNLANELSERDHEIKIVLQNKEGGLLKQINGNVQIIGLDSEPFIPAFRDLRTYLKRSQPDVLLSTVNTANLKAILASKTSFVGTRHIVIAGKVLSRNAERYGDRLTDRPIPYLMKLLYPRVDELVATSEGVRGDIVRNYRVDQDNIEVIHNPCISERSIESGARRVDNEWLNDPETVVILGAGRLADVKDFSSLVSAFAIFREEADVNAKLLIIGEGDWRDRLEDLCESLGVDEDVDLAGEKRNPFKYMSKSDLFVLSSKYEGFGNVLVEALSFGTPVVATDCPHGPREILKDGKYGPLVPVGDPHALSEAIRTTLRDPPDPESLKSRAQDFHVDTIATQYEELLYQS